MVPKQQMDQEVSWYQLPSFDVALVPITFSRFYSHIPGDLYLVSIIGQPSSVAGVFIVSHDLGHFWLVPENPDVVAVMVFVLCAALQHWLRVVLPSLERTSCSSDAT